VAIKVLGKFKNLIDFSLPKFGKAFPKISEKAKLHVVF